MNNNIGEMGFRIERPLVKKYFLTSEIVNIIHESSSCIRVWDQYFEVCKRRNNKGERLFSRTELAKLYMIQSLLRNEKYTFKGAKLQLQKLRL